MLSLWICLEHLVLLQMSIPSISMNRASMHQDLHSFQQMYSGCSSGTKITAVDRECKSPTMPYKSPKWLLLCAASRAAVGAAEKRCRLPRS